MLDNVVLKDLASKTCDARREAEGCAARNDVARRE
jgi:hypothetical protein